MTKLIACSIYDSKLKTYHPPMYFKSTGEALRSFMDVVDDNQNMIHRHPEDFALINVGEFDINTATLTGSKAYTCIARAHEVISEKSMPKDELKAAIQRIQSMLEEKKN